MSAPASRTAFIDETPPLVAGPARNSASPPASVWRPREQAALGDVDTAEAQVDILPAGDTRAPRRLLSGWACRLQDLPPNRKRIIYSFIVPGDVYGLGAARSGAGCRIVSLTRSASRSLWAPSEEDHLRRRVVERACAAHEEQLLRNSIRRFSTLSVPQRIADMLCELEVRLQAVGLSDGAAFALPIRWRDLGSSVGATPSQVTRALQSLRRDGILSCEAGTVTILSRKALEDLIGLPARERSWPALACDAAGSRHG